MIPSTIHRVWLDDPMPTEFEEYGRRWRELHPGWEVIDWRRSSDLPNLVNQDHFDRARELCPKDWKRYQSDLLRLELLWQYGGVYVDTDVEPLKPLDDLVNGLPTGAFASWSPNKAGNTRLLTQFILGSTPGHPWVKACIDGIPDATRAYGDRPLAQMIGPHHVTRVWRDRPEDVTVFEPYVFGPQSNRDRDRGRKPDLSRAYAWHRWANSRDNRRGGVK